MLRFLSDVQSIKSSVVCFSVKEQSLILREKVSAERLARYV